VVILTELKQEPTASFQIPTYLLLILITFLFHETINICCWKKVVRLP